MARCAGQKDGALKMFWRSGRCATVNHVQAMATCVAASALQELHQGYDKASTACELAEL